MQANYSPTSDLNSPFNQIINIVAPSSSANSGHIPTETGNVWTIDIPGYAGDNPVKQSDCGGWGCPLPVPGTFLPYSGVNFLAYTGHFGGTSAAAPQVAGVAALMLSVNPNLTQLQVAEIIKATARKARSNIYHYRIVPQVSAVNTWNPRMGHGVVNAYAAVQEVVRCLTKMVYFSQPVIVDRIVPSCGSINTQNVTISNGATLTLDAWNNIYLQNVTVTNNSRLILYAGGEVFFNGDFYVQLGSQLEMR